MAKPTQLPRWASGAGAVITPEPTEGKKDTGWVVSEKPPAQTFNWWMRRVYEWLSYLDTITNEALTWAAKHTFSGGLATPVPPTAGNDVVNKTYADDLMTVYGVAGSSPAAGWSFTTQVAQRSGRIVLVHFGATRTGAGTMTIGTLPVGIRPSYLIVLPGWLLQGATRSPAFFNFDTDGSISCAIYDNGASLVGFPTLNVGDTISVSGTFVAGS